MVVHEILFGGRQIHPVHLQWWSKNIPLKPTFTNENIAARIPTDLKNIPNSSDVWDRRVSCELRILTINQICCMYSVHCGSC